MPARKLPSSASASSSSGRGIRTIAPLLPLAIALVHGAVGGKPAPAPGPGGAPVQTVSSGPVAGGLTCGTAGASACEAPYPLLAAGHPVDWWFVYKLDAAKFPRCGGGVDGRVCPFEVNGKPGPYSEFGLRYVFASSETPTLADGGKDCMGESTNDPVGATFDEVYHGKYHYVIWNDQFKGAPTLACGANCDGAWGHSKGMVAWNEQGEGFVMQVTTPSWPGSGSAKFPRVGDGNTLGCVNDNDVEFGQHFFALRLTEPDLVTVLHALADASVVTAAKADPKQPGLVNNGGPQEVQDAVKLLGIQVSKNTDVTKAVLSSGVTLFAKPPKVAVPPWQMVSSLLGGVSLRTGDWSGDKPVILSTTGTTPVGCMETVSYTSLKAKPGAVDIATTGQWDGTSFSLQAGMLGGSASGDGNHAKIGVSTSGTAHYAIFGDMNQQGSLTGNCSASQNGRGGMFFVMENTAMWTSLSGLLQGESAPTTP